RAASLAPWPPSRTTRTKSPSAWTTARTSACASPRAASSAYCRPRPPRPRRTNQEAPSFSRRACSAQAKESLMKRFTWKIALSVIPVVLTGLIVARAFHLYQRGEGGFKLGVDLVGGTILVYEVDESKKLEDY